ncbi:MAG: exosortase/archaeosortase family protein [Phycisphaerae bacterium]
MMKNWSRNGWSPYHLVAVIALVIMAFAACYQAWADILHIVLRFEPNFPYIGVNDEEASQVLLVPFIVFWMVWIRRRRLRKCRPIGGWIGPALVIFGGSLSLFGYYQGFQSFWHGGAVLVLAGAILSVLGKDILYNFLPAFAVLIFLVPAPATLRENIALPMQKATAIVTQQVFDVIGVPVERSGNLLSINGTDVTIAEACNGMRMVFALFLACYAFAFGTPLRWYARLIIIAGSPIAAIICNVIRLIPTLWFYGHSSHEFATAFHDISGWIMLPIAFLMLLSIVGLLKWALIPITPHPLAYD